MTGALGASCVRRLGGRRWQGWFSRSSEGGPRGPVLRVTGGKARSTGCGGRGCCDMPGLGGQRQRPPVGAGRCEPLVTSLWSNPLPFFFFFNIYLLLQVLVEACGISFPDQGSNTALGAQSPSRWATEEAPNLCLLPEAERPSAQKTLWRQ